MNFENTPSTPEQSIAEISEQMRIIDTMTDDQDGVISSSLKEFENGDTIQIPAEKQGVMQSLAEQLKKNKLVKAAAFALTLSATAPAFSQDVSKFINLKPDNSTLTTTLQAIESGKKVAADSQGDSIEGANSYVTKSGRIVLKKHNEREGVFNGLSTVTSTMRPDSKILIHGKINNLPQEQLLQDTLNNIPTQKKYLPGVTINGGPAYEIAPGVYGNKYSIHSDGVSAGTVTIE